MTLLVAGLVLFLAIHSAQIVAPQWRRATVARVGEGAWKGLYSVVATIGLMLIVVGYGAARREPIVLYGPPPGLRHVALLVMAPVFPLLFAAYLPGRIQRAVKHPMLLAVVLWTISHLLANGALADVCLFGSFLVWAVADRIAVARRPREIRGTADADGRRGVNDAIAVFAGAAVYGATLLWLHRWLIGVSPLA